MKWAATICLASLTATCAQPPTLLEEVHALGELRAITRNSPTTYYTGFNGPEGPEYDLIKGFANFIGVELSLQTADRFSDLIHAVESGNAHVAAAGLTATPELESRVAMGPTYQTIKQYLVYKYGTGRPKSVDDLVGKNVQIVSNSSYVDILKNVQEVNPDFIWSENPHTDMTELLMSVSRQDIDYTITDSTLYDVYKNYVPEVRIGFELAMGDSLAWAFQKRYDSSLRDIATAYIKFISENGDLDRIIHRYYGHTKQLDYVGTRRFMRDYNNKLPALRHMFEQSANDLNMDWRLLAAIGYQESHWDPDAVSPTGVRGVMMLTRQTAQALGIEDRVDPVQSISGGATYLAQIRSRIPDHITEPDRTWFALAAYNVGFGHIKDARRITKQLGKDQNAWVHVKKSLLLLAEKPWYSKTVHGYARGWEPVRYVENIRNYYDILVWLSRDKPKNPRQEEIRPGTVAHDPAQATLEPAS